MNEKFFDLKKEKQDRMINAALKIFALGGYKHASTDDIVNEAGISKGLLFHYFGSKLGLYSFLYDYSVRFMKLEMTGGVSSTEQDYFEIRREMEYAKMQVLKNYPYMQQFLDRCRFEDVSEALMAIERQKNVATMKMFPCMLFLNGEYWGVYYVTEAYNDAYVSEHYDVAEDNVVIVKPKAEDVELEDGMEGDLELYYDMIQYIISHDMRNDDAYQKVCEMLDIDSFVDYYALQIYIGNHDWPGNNIALWRAREKSTSHVWADGRWRYMLFDTNYLSVLGDPMENDLERAIAKDAVFASLIQNAEVRQKFWNCVDRLESDFFNTANSEDIFNRWYDEMSESVEKSDERFYNMEELEDISDHINSMKLFIKERPAYMEKYMSECLRGEK